MDQITTAPQGRHQRRREGGLSVSKSYCGAREERKSQTAIPRLAQGKKCLQMAFHILQYSPDITASNAE